MVNHKLLQPQEIEVWYILPAIRRELAIAMKNLNLEQKDIARILGISAAAVSNYFTAKRATEVKFDEEMRIEIEKAANMVIKDNSRITSEIQTLLKSMLIKKVVCDIHKAHCNVGNNCEVCFQE